MKKVTKILLIVSPIVLIADFFILINQNNPVGPFWRKAGDFIGIGSLIVFVLCVFYLLTSWLISLFKKRRELKNSKPESQPKTETKPEKIREKKRWQPVNIILGLIIIGCVLYFSLPHSSFIAILRLIPAVILILTKKNNIFTAIALCLFGLTLFLLPSLDAFLLLVAAVYMFFSALLRMYKVKWHVVIGLAVAVVFGLVGFYTLAIEKMQTFVSESSLVIVREIDDRSGITLSSTGNEADISTTFNPRQPIYPIEKGLQKDVDYACRIINKTGEAVIPLDKWPVFKLKENSDSVQRGVFNDADYLPLHTGDYNIQLVRLEKEQGIIVAESVFSVVLYDKQILSEFVAYLTEDSHPGEKYFYSYTVNNTGENDKFSVSVWAQTPKGKTISGTVKFFKTNYDGVIEKTPWDSERGFKTNSNGEPVSISSMSGRIPPSIYHFQIAVEDDILADLKLIIP